MVIPKSRNFSSRGVKDTIRKPTEYISFGMFIDIKKIMSYDGAFVLDKKPSLERGKRE